MIGLFKKKEIQIYPRKASQHIGSLALLIASGGYPFSDWQDPDVALTQEEKELIEPACNCLQLFFYRYAYGDRHLLGDVMLGSVLAVVQDNNPSLANLYKVGVDLFEDTMIFLMNHSSGDREFFDKLPSYFAVNWERNYNREEILDDITDETSNKLLKCLLYARTTGGNALEPMINAIDEFDLDEIEQLSYRANKGLLEDVLYKRSQYSFLFKHMPVPNASMLLESRQKEHQLAHSLSVKKGAIEKTFLDNIQKDNITYQSLKDSYLDFIRSIDEIRSLLVNISGVDCSQCLKEVESFRAKYSDFYLKLVAETLPEKLDVEIEFNLKLNEIYEKFLSQLNLANLAEYVHSDEVISYLFTLDDRVIVNLHGHLKLDLILEYFKHHNLLDDLNEDQREFVNAKLRHFSI